jgi:plastocyanin
MDRRFLSIVAVAWYITALASNLPAEAQTTHTVQLLAIQFSPSDLTVRVGDTVRWEWASGFHNVESGAVTSGSGAHDDRFRSGDPTLAAGTVFDLLFDDAFLVAHPTPDRVYPYYCVVHDSVGMVGSITVVDCFLDTDCTDATPCTDDRCEAGTCQQFFNAATCDDENSCTSKDVCAAGVCSGTLVPGCCRAHADCSDGNVCTTDVCENGGCRFGPTGTAACDDGNPCTDNDSCQNGSCVGSPRSVCCSNAADCNDVDPCTDDRCIAGVCMRDFNQAACDDNDPCTTADACSEGACAGTFIEGCCETDDECPAAPCSESRCVQRRCLLAPLDGCETCEADSDCDDEDVCTDDACESGECHRAFNDAECDDGDDCTNGDVCRTGSCAGVPQDGCCHGDHDCADEDPCTDDACVDGECVFTPATTGCDVPGDEPAPGDDDGSEEPGDGPVGQEVPGIRLCGLGAMVPLLICALLALAAPRRKSELTEVRRGNTLWSRKVDSADPWPDKPA